MNLSREEIRGHLDLMLLCILDEGATHGYDVIRALREQTDGALELAEGTLYPALRRLEADGLLDSEWAVVGGRRRRVYELNDAGREELERRKADWFRFATVMRRLVEPA